MKKKDLREEKLSVVGVAESVNLFDGGDRLSTKTVQLNTL